MSKKKLPVGIEDFKEIRTEDFYYVDKTSMIRDLLNAWGKVNLFTRPRRFGKSLNMSMLKCFFEIGADGNLFNGLDISKETELCERYMGQFPVISISLKSVNASDYATARAMMCSVIGDEALRFSFLSDSDRLLQEEKILYRQLIMADVTGQSVYAMTDAALTGSLKTLSRLLKKHYGKEVIILIDEYDVPLAKANENGYYEQMVCLMRGMFDQALKSNASLHFAVLTGCLRVSKESIFTGMNNQKIHSVTTVRFDEYFGFTDDEVRQMLHFYENEDKYETVREWYDGYHFGNTDVYCPWDVINYCAELIFDPFVRPQNYWINSSGNDIVRRFIQYSDVGRTRREIESLIAGETVVKEIHEELTYSELYDSIDNIWSVLFTTGYLTLAEKPTDEQYRLMIPNREIRNIFTQQIMTLFRENVQRDGKRLHDFCHALQTGDAAEAERLFTDYLDKTITIRDTFVRKEKKENFYHGILVGILGFKGDWYVKSNEQTGDGYSDILIEIEREDIGMIIEVKYADNAKYTDALTEAFDQIERLDYVNKLRNDDFHTVYKYGIACYKRRCRVQCEKVEFESEK
ncbi:MAG: ATP-binding protein [Lachnospiraceae bacterium]|nr:ATP-binding protein [Lachnospiraceae bacterium]